MNDSDLDPMGDRLHEECGVFGVAGHEDAAALTALGLYALQHRGQEAAGITSYDGNLFHSEKRLGLVGDHFTSEKTMQRLQGQFAIGHVRYSTFGGANFNNIQPLFADLSFGGLACAHNGHLTNAVTLRKTLVKSGSIFQSTSDTESILHLAARETALNIVDRIVETLHQLEGAYALTLLTNDLLIGARDPLGIRPLVLGKLGDAAILASESCALDMIGATLIRDVAPGELIIADKNNIRSLHPFPKMRPRPCIFEYVYFSRPDSIISQRSIYSYRRRTGEILAQEAPAQTDIVVPVPDSGVPAAIGYAAQAKTSFEIAITRNHYVGRTFIEPTQHIRQLGVRIKHNPNRGLIDGAKITLIDDSIVRGTTAKKIVQMLYEAGAREVHMRIACPPIRFPDFYGIDTPSYEELLANRFDEEGIRKFIGVDSLAFISLDGLYRAMGCENGRNQDHPQFTDHCFTGDYPTTLTDHHAELSSEQLSLLSNTK